MYAQSVRRQSGSHIFCETWQKRKKDREFHTRGKNDFAEGSKILLDTDLKIILFDHQNNFVGNLKTMSNAAKSSSILATSLNVLHNYFEFNKIAFDL